MNKAKIRGREGLYVGFGELTFHSAEAFLVSFTLFLFPFHLTASAVFWVRTGDQAPATASAEAAERGEEEQTAAQRCRHSGS